MKKAIFLLLTTVCFCSVFAISSGNAGGDSFTQKDRELLIRIDERLNQIDKRFEQVDKRLEQQDKRIAELRSDMNKRFETFQQLMIAILGAFTAIVAVTIGFAIWDRRTMIRKARDEAIERIEKEGRLRDFIRALRAYAEKNRELAEILRSFNLL